MALSGVVSEINGDITRKLQIFPLPCILHPRWRGFQEFPLELGIGAGGQKLEWWGYWAEKEVWQYPQPVDTIH